MKRLLMISLLSIFLAAGISAQEGKILFLYEESNENLDPWIAMLQDGLNRRQIPYTAMASAEINQSELATYDRIFIYGAVMAFTMKEPVRDWLKTGPDLSGKKVSLLVTCNRWFLEKYTGQLEELLKRNHAVLVDSVSGATKNLGEAEKKELAEKSLNSLE